MKAMLLDLLVFNPSPWALTRERVLISLLLDVSLTALYIVARRGGVL